MEKTDTLAGKTVPPSIKTKEWEKSKAQGSSIFICELEHMYPISHAISKLFI